MNKDFQRLLKYFSYLGKVTALFAIYFITARFGLSFGSVSGFATFIWPPTGIALATTLLFGIELWPGIFLAAVLVNFSIGASLPVAIGIGVGNTLGPIFGTYAFRKIAGFYNLERLKCALTLVLVAFLSSIISATIGNTSLLLGKTISLSSYLPTWLAWWIGDSLGILLVGSLLLINWKEILRSKLNYSTLAHFFAIESFLILSSIIAFWGVFDSPSIFVFYLIFSPLIWAALRFGQSGGVVAVFSMTFIAVWGVVNGYGSFASGSLSENLKGVQIFMSSIAVNILILGAVVSERKNAQKSLQDFNKNLENKVNERTGELRESERRYRLLSEDLEKRVNDRTRELGEKVSELEKLNKFMVGRELKMIELKEEIKKFNTVPYQEVIKPKTARKRAVKVNG